MQITQEVREYARAQGIADDSEALERGMEAKSQEFRAEGAELYPGA
jgi:phosphomethylpyrimidine synthase